MEDRIHACTNVGISAYSLKTIMHQKYTIVEALMIARCFFVLAVVFTEWQVVHLLITIFHCISSGPREDVLNDGIWNRMPTYIIVRTIFGSIVLPWWLYVLSIVVLQLTVIVGAFLFFRQRKI